MAETGSKGWWRAELRRRDRSSDPALEAAVRRGIADFVAGLDGRVLAYRSLPDEVDLDPLIDGAPDRFAVTRTPDVGDLTIHRADAPTEVHRFGFVQPRADAPTLADAEIAAVLVPGLGFSVDGVRLGRGKGHYDRLLPRLRAGIPVVGVATSVTVVEVLPSEEHDRPVTHLATEAGVRPVGVRPWPPPRRGSGGPS